MGKKRVEEGLKGEVMSNEPNEMDGLSFDSSAQQPVIPQVQRVPKYVEQPMTEEVQEELSNKTMLAPVHYRAQAYDRQADDVRFWSASCKGGAVPDLYLGVYQRKPEELAEMCKEIRNYVR